jgi:hypothetical protein
MQMMKSVAQEVAEKRIRVNGIAPGAIKTNINKRVWGIPEAERKLLTLIPYGRVGEPEDVATAAVWLGIGRLGLRHRHDAFRRRRHDTLPGFPREWLKASGRSRRRLLAATSRSRIDAVRLLAAPSSRIA